MYRTYTHTLIELKKIAQILYLCSKGFLTQVSKNIYFKYFNETRCRLPGYMSKVNKNRQKHQRTQQRSI